MLETIFRGVFDTQLTNTITPEQFLLCVGASLVIGLVLCVLMLWHARPSAGFAITLATLPAGLMAGMGYLGYAVLFTLILGGATMAYHVLGFGGGKNVLRCRTLHITIPEDLDYTGVFDPVLEQYAARSELKQVKTTNMGSLFKLTYDLTLRDGGQEKALIDALRQRNGNLEISLCQQETGAAGL